MFEEGESVCVTLEGWNQDKGLLSLQWEIRLLYQAFYIAVTKLI